MFFSLNKKNLFVNNVSNKKFKKKIFIYFYTIGVNRDNKSLNQFFNFNDNIDEKFYLFYDVINWDKKKKWLLIRPHGLSFFFKFAATKKWKYTRLINIVNRSVFQKKIKQNFKNNEILWEQYYFNKQNDLNKSLVIYYQFKLQNLLFKFKYFYFFYLLKKSNIYFFFAFYFNKYFKKNLYCPVKSNIYYFLNVYFQLYVKSYLLKKNNNNFMFFGIKYLFFIKKKILFVALFNFELFAFILYWQKKRYLFFNKLMFKRELKEKQKLKNFLSKFYSKSLFAWIREDLIVRKLIAKKRFRRKKGEKKIYIHKIKKKRKKRTNLQILRDFFKKEAFQDYLDVKIIDILSVVKFFNLVIKYYYNFFFFKFLQYSNKVIFVDIDYLYSFYLPQTSNNRKMYRNILIGYLDDNIFDTWTNPFKKGNLDYLSNNFNMVTLQGHVGNIKDFKKLNIKGIYKFLVNKHNYCKKKYMFLALINFIALIRFLKKNNLILKNYDFIYNIYFWVILFLRLVNQSKILIIKKFLDFTSFLKIITVLFKNKYTWFNVKNFQINLNIISFKNLVVKFKCSFNFLLQEVCIYLYYNIFKISPKLFNQNLYNKITQATFLKNIQYIFKGNLGIENNYVLCLSLIQKSTGNSLFFKIIENFFLNCELSFWFIKKNIQLYLNLLELTYNKFDNFIYNLINYFSLKAKLYYMRYMNVVLICSTEATVELVQFILKNFIFFFMYYVFKIYFFLIIIINFNKQPLDYLNYLICKEKNKIVIQPSLFSFIKLLFFYKFAQKENGKIIVKAANYLLFLPIVRIFNYFFNIWINIYYYYKFKNKINLNYFCKIIAKACFLTIFLKLKNKNRMFNYKQFKKIFIFKYNYKNINIINKKILNLYILNQNKLNINHFANKYKQNLRKFK